MKLKTISISKSNVSILKSAMTDSASTVEQGLIVPIAAVHKIKTKYHLPYGWRNRQ